MNTIIVAQEVLHNPIIDTDGAIFSSDGKVLLSVPLRGSKHYIVPKGVEHIAAQAFYRAEWIESIELPSSLQSLGTNALYIFDELSISPRTTDRLSHSEAREVRRAAERHYAYMQGLSGQILLEDEYYVKIGDLEVAYTVSEQLRLPRIVVPDGERERFYALLEGKDESGAISMEMEDVELVTQSEFYAKPRGYMNEAEVILTRLYEVNTSLAKKLNWEGAMTTYKKSILSSKGREIFKLHLQMRHLLSREVVKRNPPIYDDLKSAIKAAKEALYLFNELIGNEAQQSISFSTYLSDIKHKLQTAALGLIKVSLGLDATSDHKQSLATSE